MSNKETTYYGLPHGYIKTISNKILRNVSDYLNTSY